MSSGFVILFGRLPSGDGQGTRLRFQVQWGFISFAGARDCGKKWESKQDDLETLRNWNK